MCKLKTLARKIRVCYWHSAAHFRPFNVLMLHTGRCGSSVLGRLLDQNPLISWDGEIIHYIDYGPGHSKASGNMLLDVVRSRMVRGGFKIYGCELKLWQLDDLGLRMDQLFKSLHDLRFTRVIVLERRNSLKRLVSTLKTREKEPYHIPKGQAAQKVAIRVPVQNFVFPGGRTTFASLQHALEYCESLYRAVEAKASSLRRLLWITYEDDIQENPVFAYKKCCRFIKVPLSPVRIPYAKTNPFPLQEIVTNWNELCRHLSGTRFEWMLEG